MMNIKKSWLRFVSVIVLILSTFVVTFGQQTRKDKVEALKIAFITNRMQLTPKEAQVFWPIYNEFNNRLEALKKERRRKLKSEITSLDSLSNKEIEQMIEYEMTFRQREVDLQKEFNQNMKEVMPVKKIAQFYIAEELFKKELLKRLKEKQ